MKGADAILAERARSLARPLSALPAEGASVELLTFDLTHEHYALEARYVREVLRLTHLTPVPGTPDFIAGIVNIRGEIVAVIDLRILFGIPPRGVTDLSRLIVLGLDHVELAVLADSVHEMIMLRVDTLRDPATAAPGNGRAYVRGLSSETLIMLDAAVLLADRRLFVGGADPPAAPGDRREGAA